MTASGLVATIAGWMVTEVGRQPWTIYVLVRTADVVRDITTAEVLHSLLLMGIVYTITCIAIVYLLRRFLRSGPVATGSGVGDDSIADALPHTLMTATASPSCKFGKLTCHPRRS